MTEEGSVREGGSEGVKGPGGSSKLRVSHSMKGNEGLRMSFIYLFFFLLRSRPLLHASPAVYVGNISLCLSCVCSCVAVIK